MNRGASITLTKYANKKTQNMKIVNYTASPVLHITYEITMYVTYKLSSIS